MITDTEGIVLRQTKASGGRRMISLFSKKFGKISVGTNLNEGGRNKTALAIRAFTYGRYELFKGRDSYNLNSGQVLKSYYSLGENLDKYMAASYVLELTDRLLPEEVPQPRIFNVLTECLDALEKREKKHKTLVTAYMVKLMDLMGTMPMLENCVRCGDGAGSAADGGKALFSIKEGGLLCRKCSKELEAEDEEALIYSIDFGIIDILKYFQKMPMATFENIALDDGLQETLQKILKEYISYHMDIRELKSESFF